jgi:cysteine desulfuration protein SufE
VNRAAEQLDEIVSEFQELDPRERLELLLEFAEGLPPLPPDLQAERDAGGHRVHECQTPVFLWVLPEDGRVRIHGDVAPESPTVKGFMGVIVKAFDDATCAEILDTPANIVQRLGLVDALGMQRMRGLGAISARVRAEAQQLLAAGQSR